MMKKKSSLVSDIQKSIRTGIGACEGFISKHLTESERQARDEAHLATCGDRPFIGCNPCQPDHANISAGSTPDPSAKPHL